MPQNEWRLLITKCFWRFLHAMMDVLKVVCYLSAMFMLHVDFGLSVHSATRRA